MIPKNHGKTCELDEVKISDPNNGGSPKGKVLLWPCLEYYHDDVNGDHHNARGLRGIIPVLYMETHNPGPGQEILRGRFSSNLQHRATRLGKRNLVWTKNIVNIELINPWQVVETIFC